MLVRKCELNPLKGTSLGVAQESLTPKRYHLKWNRLNYQLLFRKGARARRLDLRDQQKSRLHVEMEIRAFLSFSFIFLSAPKRNFDS